MHRQGSSCCFLRIFPASFKLYFSSGEAIVGSQQEESHVNGQNKNRKGKGLARKGRAALGNRESPVLENTR